MYDVLWYHVTYLKSLTTLETQNFLFFLNCSLKGNVWLWNINHSIIIAGLTLTLSFYLICLENKVRRILYNENNKTRACVRDIKNPRSGQTHHGPGISLCHMNYVRNISFSNLKFIKTTGFVWSKPDHLSYYSTGY